MDNFDILCEIVSNLSTDDINKFRLVNKNSYQLCMSREFWIFMFNKHELVISKCQYQIPINWINFFNYTKYINNQTKYYFDLLQSNMLEFNMQYIDLLDLLKIIGKNNEIYHNWLALWYNYLNKLKFKNIDQYPTLDLSLSNNNYQLDLYYEDDYSIGDYCSIGGAIPLDKSDIIKKVFEYFITRNIEPNFCEISMNINI